MIVFGGNGTFPPPAPNAVDLVFADGGRYDPANDSWTLTPPDVGRRWHPAVWTGTRMIVWGGRDAFALSISTMNAGSIYDPSLNAWAQTAASNAPTARAGHTAVWTGFEMIIWGGTTNGTTLFGTGGVYDPGNNAWRSVPTTGAPIARYDHTAVWTGHEMIVWGGLLAGGNLTATGAAYDPLVNTWRTLTNTGAPAARTEHTAIWTGTAMIVWGGRTRPTDTYLNSGGAGK